eukprot:6103289-Amphidinium_carterae.1
MATQGNEWTVTLGKVSSNVVGGCSSDNGKLGHVAVCPIACAASELACSAIRVRMRMCSSA